MKYYKNLSIDESNCTVKKEGQPIHLTAMEYQLFVTSALKQGGAASANTQERPSYFYLSEQYRQVISSAVQHTENFYSVVFPVHTVENQLL